MIGHVGVSFLNGIHDTQTRVQQKGIYSGLTLIVIRLLQLLCGILVDWNHADGTLPILTKCSSFSQSHHHVDAQKATAPQ